MKATDFQDEDTDPECTPLHPEVISWAENMTKAVRHYHAHGGCTADVVADFDRLLEMARGGR